MSHFACLVVTDQKPSDELLSKVLQPFHEFECTGVSDEYVQNIDKLAEAREEFERASSTMLRAPDGQTWSPYLDRFYLDPTEEEMKIIGPVAGTGSGGGLSWSSKDWGDGKGYRTKVRKVPTGWTEVVVKDSELKSFGAFIEDWFGYKRVGFGEEPDLKKKHKFGWYREDKDGNVTEVFDRTNPEKKWDWWQLGGRFSGALLARPGVKGTVKGEPGLMGCEHNAAGVDMIRKGDVDFAAMRSAAATEACALWNKVRGIVGDMADFVKWEEMRDVRHKGDIEAARTAYHDQPAAKLIHEASKKDRDLVWIELDEFVCSREEYMNNAANRATLFFATLKDGKWCEKGSMGWWGCVSNEDNEWASKFNEALDALPDDCWLSVVDCHI